MTESGLFQFRDFNFRWLRSQDSATSAYTHAPGVYEALYAAHAVRALSTVEVLAFMSADWNFRTRKAMVLLVLDLLTIPLMLLCARGLEAGVLNGELLGVVLWMAYWWWSVGRWKHRLEDGVRAVPGRPVTWLHKQVPTEHVRQCEERLDAEAFSESLE